MKNLNEEGRVLVAKFNETKSFKNNSISRLLTDEKRADLSLILTFMILMLALPLMVLIIFILLKLYQHAG